MTSLEKFMGTPAAPAPGEVSQATAVEQSRAVAEVQAQVIVAQQCPRDEDKAEKQMRSACSRRALAEKAFFSFPRAGETIAGPSIHLARELARCWGNVNYGISELRRDDAAGISEMLAYAWDIEGNTRSSSTFIVPHARDTKKGRKQIIDLRDIYENNANQGARRVREAIYAVLPCWFREEAERVAKEALTALTPEQVRQRAQEAVTAFGRGHITQEQLEEKVGASVVDWTAEDVADLEILFQSLKRREITKEEAFPPPRLTAAEVQASAEAAALNGAVTVAARSYVNSTETAETQVEDPPAEHDDAVWPEPAPVGGAR